MPDAKFLETYPLYRKFHTSIPVYLSGIPKPPINMHCNNCGSIQTFNITNEYWEHSARGLSPAGEVIRAIYQCAACGYKRFFLLRFSEHLDYVKKVGQYPPWEITPDKNLTELLGEHQDYYKKGLVCESQGYGIGSYAYYRRIIEEIIDNLLNSIADLIPESEEEQYRKALEQTKKTIVAQEKIEIVKDLLPDILRPNGMNPLSLLHTTLSEGLHAKTDENCLEAAGSVREILIFLVNRILQTKESSKKFTTSMRKLLEKKSGKDTQPKNSTN